MTTALGQALCPDGDVLRVKVSEDVCRERHVIGGSQKMSGFLHGVQPLLDARCFLTALMGFVRTAKRDVRLNANKEQEKLRESCCTDPPQPHERLSHKRPEV